MADRTSAVLQAAAQGSRVEITDERTETGTTYANPDGTGQVIEGNTATYQLDANTKMGLTVTPDGMEESLVLAAAPADPAGLAKLGFGVKTTNLSLDPAAATSATRSGTGGRIDLDNRQAWVSPWVAIKVSSS